MKQLVVHIGTGKTGSTAIQSYFRRNKLECEKAKIDYWGLNLEYAPIMQQYEWRKPDGTAILQRMPESQASQEVTHALMEALKSTDKDSLIIWSNESIYEKPSIFIPAIQSCARQLQLQVKIVAYARNLRSYVRSAYAQWGVKHKTYQGRIKSFKEWGNESIAFLSYGIKLERWNMEFNGSFALVNYDSIDDVVDDFKQRIGLPVEQLDTQRSKREYSSPSDIHLALYALYNNTYNNPVLPSDITRLLRQNNCDSGDYAFGDLTRIFPKDDDLNEITRQLQNQQDLLNAILAGQNQPQLQSFDWETDRQQPDRSSIVEGVIALLLRIIVKQNERISTLENQRGTNRREQ